MYNTVWYDNLIKPLFQPPEWVFLPVWIILYGTLLISLLLYLIAKTDINKKSGYIYFIIHMIFNFLWSPVFFCFHRMDIALVIILIMDLSAIFMITKFYKVYRLAGIILFPYFLWLIFATYLNIQFCILNK